MLNLYIYIYKRWEWELMFNKIITLTEQAVKICILFKNVDTQALTVRYGSASLCSSPHLFHFRPLRTLGASCIPAATTVLNRVWYGRS